MPMVVREERPTLSIHHVDVVQSPVHECVEHEDDDVTMMMRPRNMMM